jgi:hypothetical protein
MPDDPCKSNPTDFQLPERTMNRRTFALQIAAGTGLLTAAPFLAPVARAGMQPAIAPGWSSARAVEQLCGLRYRVDQAPDTVLRLSRVAAYRDDDRQFTVRFEVDGPTPAEGTYRLRGGGSIVDLFLQQVQDRSESVEAVFCHACG